MAASGRQVAAGFRGSQKSGAPPGKESPLAAEVEQKKRAVEEREGTGAIGALPNGARNGHFRSLRGERVKAMAKTIADDQRFINAAVVMVSYLFVLLLFKFYPLWLLPVILAVIGVVSFRSAPYGTIFATIIALPAVAYQSPLFAWAFLLVLSAVMFNAFGTWKLISLLFALVCAPFTGFGVFVIPLHVVSGLLLGSKKGALVTAIGVLSVLVLSALWSSGNVPINNSGYMVFNAGHFSARMQALNAQVFDYVKINRNPEPSFLLFITGGAFTQAYAGFFNWTEIKNLTDFFTLLIPATYVLFFEDSAFMQVLMWTVAVFIIGYLPGRVRWRYKDTIASFATFIIPFTVLIASYLSGVYGLFDFTAFPMAIATICFIFVVERAGIDLSRENRVIKEEKMQKFSKFGLQDLSLAPGVESLRDIGGYENTKKELYDAIVTTTRRKELQSAYGLKPPKGVLLFGPPGTGKTMVMRALAREMDIGFYYVKCTDLLSQWYGETEHNIAELFRIARANAPCVLFFDEIDSIGKRRDAYTTDDVAPRLLSTMLGEMDGFKSDKSVIIAGATNVPQMLDPALMRPGRFDKIIYLPLPDEASRKQILKVHSRGLPLDDDVDFDELAHKMDRYSGAEIANVVKEAATRASRFGLESDRVVPVTMEDFRIVLDHIKPSTTMTQMDDFERFRQEYERRVDPEKKSKDSRAVTWKDVIGLDDVREALLEAIELPLLHEGLLKEYGVAPVKGILLFGPPGCGKTMIVKAAANELNVTFLYLSGADLMKMGYDGAVTEIKNVFNRAKENVPAVIFIDELDAVAPSRAISSSTPMGEKLVGQLLNEMDGTRELRNVLFMGATNRPEMLDSAMLRPGRMDKILFIHPPLLEGRARIFETNLRDIPDSQAIDYVRLARRSDGFTGADVASVCQEAKMQLVRKRLAGKRGELRTDDILAILSERRASVTPQTLEPYLRFMRDYGERR